MTRLRIVLVFQFLIFLIPLNIYMWGDWLLVSAQWVLFRYQQSEYGTSVILGHKEILYLYLGQTTGLYNIAAALFWTVGSVILLIGLCITVIAFLKINSFTIKTSSYFTLGGGIFLGLSAITRFYGGFAIPVGIPFILLIGWWMHKEKFNPEEIDERSNDQEPPAPE